MAHKINDMLNRIDGKEPRRCDYGCKYFFFSHLDRACVLSEVFSVRKGEMCYEYTPTENPKKPKGA